MKSNWTAPELTVHGNVEEVTQRRGKKLGKDDGVVLIGVPSVPDGTPVGS